MKREVQELCRRLQPVLGRKIDRLWNAYLAESDAGGKADIEQTLKLEPRHFGAIWGLGMILGSQRDYQRAINAFELLLEIKPNAGDARPRIELLKQELARESV